MTVATLSSRFTSISATAGQTVLAWDFELTADYGLAVLRIRDGDTARLVLGDDYAFPGGLGNAAGGTLTLAAGALDGDIYQLVGLLPEKRISDFVSTQAFAAAKFNADLDTLTLVAQEHRRDIDRGLKVPLGSTAELELAPAPNQFIGWNLDGTALENKSAAAGLGDLLAANNLADVNNPSRAADNLKIIRRKTVPLLLADTVLANATAPGKVAVAAGQIIEAGGFRYEVAASGASDHHLATAGGIKLYVLPDGAGKYNATAFGAGSGLVDDFAVCTKMMAVADRAHFPVGTYLLSDALEMRDGQRVTGANGKAKLVSTGTNKRILFASGKSQVSVEGLRIEGNLTGDGSTAGTSAGGEGVSFYSCTDVRVKNCVFSKIGRTTTGSFVSCIRGDFVDGAWIEGNLFLDDNGSTDANTGADINFSYYCKNLTITGNVSRSSQDEFISLAAVGNSDDLGQFVITGNRGYRADGSASRSGILVPYSAKRARAVIADNYLENFTWNGIYLSAAAGIGIDDSAGATITGNIIVNCGGGSSQNISAGIYGSGRAGVTCTGNLVKFSGYDKSGSARTYNGVGICVFHTTRDAVVANNVITDSKTYGIHVQNFSGTLLENVLVSGNVVRESGATGIQVDLANAAAAMRAVAIINNQILQEAIDAHGIYLQCSSGATDISRIRIAGNAIETKFASATKYGIHIGLPAAPKDIILGDNNVIGFARGIDSSTLLADKIIGTEVILDGNVFQSCATALYLVVGAGSYCLHFNSTIKNCAAETYDAGRNLAASRLGSGRFEIRRATAPTDGAWNQGDKVLFTTPSAGGPIGAVCVTAGSPGTWRNYSAILAEGTATYDPPSLAAGAVDTPQTMTVTGAALNDFVDVSFSVALAGARLEAWVSAANTVSYRFSNPTGSAIDLGSGTVKARVRK